MEQRTFVVTGSGSGLGKAISNALENEGHIVIGWTMPDVDVRLRSSLELAAVGLGEADIDGIINCAGINLIEWIKDTSAYDWDNVMATNAKGILNTFQVLYPFLKRNGVICNIVSDAAQRPMTASIAYNASKAAAHIMTFQMARELRHKFIVFGISPGKLRGTAMSDYVEERVPEVRNWTKSHAEQYQANALLNGEVPPERIAELLVWLLSDHSRTRYLSGCIIPYGG